MGLIKKYSSKKQKLKLCSLVDHFCINGKRDLRLCYVQTWEQGTLVHEKQTLYQFCAYVIVAVHPIEMTKVYKPTLTACSRLRSLLE